MISLLPVIGIVKVGYQAAADRYTYIPMIGFFIASAGGIAIILQHSGKFITLKYIILAAAFLSIASLTTLTKQQNTYWENDEKLWSRAIELYPGLAGLAYSNMGTIRFRERNFSAALIDYNKSLSINNNDLTIMEKIGRTYEFMGKAGLALKQYQKIVDIFPDISYSYILLGDLQYRCLLLRHRHLLRAGRVAERQGARTRARERSRLRLRQADRARLPATLQRAALADFLDNKLTDANKKLEYLFMISPDNVGAMQLAAKIHLAMGNHEQAKSFAMKILSLRKNDAFATEILAHINQSANGKSL